MDKRLYYPATERNRHAILEVLQSFFPKTGTCLEIASGSGEHLTHFAQNLTGVTFQPSDLEADCLDSIQAWADHLGLSNVRPPRRLDTTQADWDMAKQDVILCINMIHISPWEATLGLMQKAGDLLNQGGFLYLYGPYRRFGAHTAPSNESFNAFLKEKDPRFGVRDLEEVEALATENGLTRTQLVEMPANNFSVVFQRN
jgi:SAM-dependent methyltransferase